MYCIRLLVLAVIIIMLYPVSYTKGLSQEMPQLERDTNMEDQKLNEPARVVLEGVPRVDWGTGTPIGSVTPFFTSLWSCMKFLGEDYSSAYILGTSGAAFRLLWKDGWAPDNVDIRLMRKDANEPLRHAFEAVGYECEFINLEEGRDNKAYFKERIIESIRDKGHPVLGFGIIPGSPPECCIITGYDEYGDVLIGWNYYQGSPGDEGREFEPSGYFRSRNWLTEDTDGIIIIGSKTQKLSQGEINCKALKWALEIVRTPVIQDSGRRNRYNGLAAYTAWTNDLLRDEDFPADDMGKLGWIMMSHDDNVNVVAEGRWCAIQFLKQMAETESAMAEDLLKAVECYEAEYNLMRQCWDLMGYGPEIRSERQCKILATPEYRRQIIPLILQARDKDAEAADHIERALAKQAPIEE